MGVIDGPGENLTPNLQKPEDSGFVVVPPLAELAAVDRLRVYLHPFGSKSLRPLHGVKPIRFRTRGEKRRVFEILI
jgi:hypothetical protein